MCSLITFSVLVLPLQGQEVDRCVFDDLGDNDRTTACSERQHLARHGQLLLFSSVLQGASASLGVELAIAYVVATKCALRGLSWGQLHIKYRFPSHP